ncbi:hypothetical protein SAMN05421788_109163 [Filimonas lacunae]|uniref:Transposase n=1 Tax=Filimonas lacunae TaxID=477680 RepID=A0A1N7R5A8_9BACT|nr:hypothetical protein [Filimonas lacunae]SIT30214.1 hypothetical protein SAMN05421788_109163 [Filimonas lacunae]
MDIHKDDIRFRLMGEEVMVSLKWMRGASRYNNGATRYGRKYHLRLVLGREKERLYFKKMQGSEQS